MPSSTCPQIILHGYYHFFSLQVISGSVSANQALAGVGSAPFLPPGLPIVLGSVPLVKIKWPSCRVPDGIPTFGQRACGAEAWCQGQCCRGAKQLTLAGQQAGLHNAWHEKVSCLHC